ncbi:MAG: hypothetical protein JW731_07085 [Bacteroidales bacterium]|nr:hypothetical protein [Bacteroidales bacterium]
MKKNLVFIGFILCMVTNPVTSTGQLSVSNLHHHPGLDGTIIYNILPDRLGNIWLVTQNGLVKYDGYEFERFFSDPDNPESINSILTFSLHEDDQGQLWIGCMNTINMYDPLKKAFRHFSYEGLTGFTEQMQTGVAGISSDSQGRIYFGIASAQNVVASHALVYYDPSEDRLKRFDSPGIEAIRNIYSIITDPFDNIWISSQNGLLKIDTAQHLHRIGLPPGILPDKVTFGNIISSDREGTIWYSTNQSSFFSYDPHSGRFNEYQASKYLDDTREEVITTAIYADSISGVWVGTNRGIVYYDRSSGKFYDFGKEAYGTNDLPSVNCFQYDSFGNLWIGTVAHGLYRYDDRTALRSMRGSLEKNSIITPGWAINLQQTSDGKVWFCTMGSGSKYSGLNELDPSNLSVNSISYENIIPGMDAVFAFTENRPGEFMMNTTEGRYLYYPQKNEVVKTTFEGIPDSVGIISFFRDSRKILWVLTYNGFYKQDIASRNFSHYDLSNLAGTTAGSNEITAVAESRRGGLWLATNGGLFFFHFDTQKIERHGFGSGLKYVFLSQDINSVCEADDETLWVGTWQGGLSHYYPETGEIKTYTISDGLPSMSIQGILEDRTHHSIWISSFDGLSRFDTKSEHFTNYSLDDGIQGLLFSDNSCLKTSGGLFIFGGNNGITYFYPERLAQNSAPPRVYITDLKIDNKSAAYGTDALFKKAIYRTDTIQLKYLQNNLALSYIGFHYSNPERNRFAYKLENYDEEWREVGSQRTAYYYNLPPGEYVFRVKAANNNGVWNEQGDFLNIFIAPPLWKTWWAYGFYFLLLILVIYNLDRHQRRRVINKERAATKERALAHAIEIEKAYNKLKTTQDQLLQSEKMASLGELTAGIAHEIQNPLNFVNNFSEVSVDLIDELDEEMIKGNLEEIRIISSDLRQNLDKISHHGKRASSIVKGMLEHSRSSSGEKVPTDINALADEYLRLAYHGLRAKDKSFNADYKLEAGESIPKVNLVQQDIGRVLLNVINNAYYACAEQSRNAEAEKTQKPDKNYKPEVIVSTTNRENHIEIRVKDNGPGIPDDIKDKIFQPFFTTKPAGQGTGLGLSMSYDIITKGHGGSLEVISTEGEGSEFIIRLPLVN